MRPEDLPRVARTCSATPAVPPGRATCTPRRWTPRTTSRGRLLLSTTTSVPGRSLYDAATSRATCRTRRPCTRCSACCRRPPRARAPSTRTAILGTSSSTSTQDIVAVDTDDLSLAPMGYDLAKLVAALHLTYGPLTDQAVTYRPARVQRGSPTYDARLGTTDRGQLDSFLGLHAVLTAPSRGGRNGYHYSLPLRFMHRGASRSPPNSSSSGTARPSATPTAWSEAHAPVPA
ncbi:hypothetical protein LV779_03015 [Streptomyces thinghirensis]|nr:hypothetical protein [Streptomyces thinghirensis]